MQRNLINDDECSDVAKKPHGFIIHADPHFKSGLRCEFFINPPPLRVLSFKGGVSRTFVYRALLQYLEKNDILNQIEEIGGSSSGCIATVFGCIPYADASDRIKAMDVVIDTDPWDMMRDTPGWKTYQALTEPFNYVSNTLDWIGSGIAGFTNGYSHTLTEKIANSPFILTSLLFKATAVVTSPYTYAALYNLITEGGVYYTENVQKVFREQIQLDVQTALDDLLEKQVDKALCIERLQLIGLIDHELKVTPDITFNHFYELSQIPGSQFKQCYLTSVGLEDKNLDVFNKDNTPHLPIHLASRLVSTFPPLMTNKSYLGKKYFDGGIINNAPVDLATKKKYPELYEACGVTDKLDRLNVRVEYPDDLKYHLWRKRPEQSLSEKISDYAVRTISSIFTRGIDSYAQDEKVTSVMQRDYAQRTLQLKDFGVSQLGSELTKEKREELCNQLMPDIEEYFNNHANEKIITNYEISLRPDQLANMPKELQIELLQFMKDKDNKSQDIFDMPGGIAELEHFRQQLIASLSKVLDISDASTTTIYRNINATQESKKEETLLLDELQAKEAVSQAMIGDEIESVNELDNEPKIVFGRI